MTKRASGPDAGPHYGILACIAGGLAAGVVAAVLTVTTSRLMGGVPPANIAAGSAFAAAFIGGLLLWVFGHWSARPAAWLWGIGLFFATAISLIVAFLPPAFLPLPRSLSVLNGLAAPLAQVLRAAGLLHPAARLAAAPPPHVPPHGRAAHHARPGGFLAAAIVMHYLTATATAIVVPWVARSLGGAHQKAAPTGRREGTA